MSSRPWLGIVAALMVSGTARASLVEYEFLPTPQDLGDLDHRRVVLWGLEPGLAVGEAVVTARLEFKNLRNADNNPNHLYVHLLDDGPVGVTPILDNLVGGNYFENLYAGEHTPLLTYSGLTTEAETRIHEFTPGQLAALNAYLADGLVALGFDPDCHYFNSYIKLTLTVPEPASIGVLLAGLLLMPGRRR